MPSYHFEIALPNNTSRKILFNHESNLKSNDKQNTVPEAQLSRYLYQQLKFDHIDPRKYHFLYPFSTVKLLNNRSEANRNQQLQRYHAPRPKEIKLVSDKTPKVKCIPYNAVYTSQTGPIDSCKCCGCNWGYGGPPDLSSNQIAFPLAKIPRLCYSICLAIPLIVLITGGMIAALTSANVDNLYAHTIIVMGMLGLVFSLYMAACIPSGRGWLIIDMVNPNNSEQDVLYIQTGWCLDRGWEFRKRHRLDLALNKFKGIRIEKFKGYSQSRLEDDEGHEVRLIFDGEQAPESDDYSWSICCGPKSCGVEQWVFLVRDYPDCMVYYEIAKFFKERYGDKNGYDLRFSIPKYLREILRDYGLKDELLDGNRINIGAWKEKEWIDLQIAEEKENDNDNQNADGLMATDGEHDENESYVKEMRDLVEFIKNENENDVAIKRESLMVNDVLDGGKYVNVMVQHFKELKKEYGWMYKERDLLFGVKLEYSKKILTLLAFKAKELKGNDEELIGGNEKGFRYAVGANVDGDHTYDGLKDSLLGK